MNGWGLTTNGNGLASNGEGLIRHGKGFQRERVKAHTLGVSECFAG